MNRLFAPFGFAAALLVVSPAVFAQNQRQVLRPINTQAPAASAAPSAAPGAAAGVDAGVKEKGKEGPEQKKRRKDYVERMRKEIHAAVPAHQLTDQDRELVRTHWRRAMRVLRVRLIAEDSNDQATVARCDNFLAKIDQALLNKLKDLHKKGAPAAAGKDGGAK